MPPARVSRRLVVGQLVLAGCTPRRIASADPYAGRRLLRVPHIRQERLLCVPTSAAMVLAFYGDPQPPRRLKAMAEGRVYDEAAFSDFSETQYTHLLRATARMGYRWEQVLFDDTSTGFEAGLARIRRELDSGRPVLVDVSIPQGHTVVAVGVDDAARTLTVVDPDAPAPGLREVDYGTLAQVWNESAFGGPFRAMVATRPRDA